MEISLIIPVYNSSEILPKLIDQILDRLNTKEQKYEIILVDDSSKDDSWKTILYLSSKNKNIKGIQLDKNYGQHNALMAGLNNCLGNYVILMDDDLQHNPKYIYEIYNVIKNNNDVCYVNYLNRQHKNWKKFVSWSNNIISSIIMNKPFNIYTSSFKGIKKKIVIEIIKSKKNEVFLDWLIINATKKIKMIDVEHQKRLSGKTNYGLKKLLLLWTSMILNVPLNPKRFSFFLLIILKIFIGIFLYSFIKKRKIVSQFNILNKTF